MVEMSPVETLRAAAERLRTEPSDPWWFSGLVHPGVAEPLAELLERAAESRESAESAVARVNGGSLIGDESPVTVEQIEERAAPAALRVARLLLGVPDGR